MVRSCFAVLATAYAAADPRQVISSRNIFPKSWNQVSRANKHHFVEFTVGVKQSNLKQLEEKFWAVSDPTNPEWQNFMKLEDINAMIAPTAEHKTAVQSWLAAVEGAHITDRGDSIKVRATAQAVEKLFDTEMHIFTHDYGHDIVRAVGDVSIPADVASAIDIVSGLTDFPMHGPRNLHRDVAAADKTTPIVIPESLKTMYKVPAGLKATGISQSVAEFQDDSSYNKQDLQTFFNQTDLPSDKVADIVGPYSGTYPDMEATLDTQYMMGVSETPEMFYWTTPGWQYEWANTFYSTKKIPESVSISWGWAESGQCQSGIAETECTTLGVDAAGYVARTNTEFQKIGLRGTSLFAASGDSGANGRTDGECTGTVLHASFPGSSPYITAVGATQFSKPEYNLPDTPTACTALGAGYKCASGGTEVAVSQPVAGFTSGGGFSTYTPMPTYQQSAVQGYLNSGVTLPPSTYFNSSNRGYPDVAALGNNFAVYLDMYGGWTTVGGTSASSPTFAAIAGYLNSVSVNKTGKPLGFLNPLLYKMAAAQPSAFTDIVSGDNKCTEDGCFSSCKGYECTTGWDPVTGLGTPVLAEMIKYVEAQLDAKASVLV
jgi:tripeptidyl-peptidase-1